MRAAAESAGCAALAIAGAWLTLKVTVPLWIVVVVLADARP